MHEVIALPDRRRRCTRRPGFLLAWAGTQDAAQSFALRLARADRLSPTDDRLEIKTRLHAIIKAPV
ncbi:MAG TPA: hypothetical protein VGY30_02175 [Solirubrobacteraceae bacterium]|nr:hypothetical protein [Solirubrobacteraceae bacterium]